MNSKISLIVFSLLVAFSIGNSQADENQIDCDGFFKNVGTITNERVAQFHLNKEYAERNQSLKTCLDFYVRYLAKTDFNLSELDYADLIASNSEMISSSEELFASSNERSKRKSSLRRKPSKPNKAF